MPNTEGKFVFTENDCVVINPIVNIWFPALFYIFAFLVWFIF